MVMFLPMAEWAIWQSGRIGKVKQTGRWQSESEAPLHCTRRGELQIQSREIQETLSTYSKFSTAWSMCGCWDRMPSAVSGVACMRDPHGSNHH